MNVERVEEEAKDVGGTAEERMRGKLGIRRTELA
jgi:hypothetical protein